MTRQTTRRRRVAHTVSAIAGTLALGSTPVAAHDYPVGTTGPLVSVTAVVLFALVLSLVGGIGVARGRTFHGVRLPPRVLGVVLVVLGGVAVVSGVSDSLPLAAAGIAAGIVVAAWVTHSRGHAPAAGCADATLGAVLLHRGVEGIVVATAAATGVVFGLVGALVFTGHAVAETCTVSGLYATTEPRRALVATALVQVAFVVGALAGVVVLATLPTAVRVAILGFTGGILLTVGVLTMRQPPSEHRQVEPRDGAGRQPTPSASEHGHSE